MIKIKNKLNDFKKLVVGCKEVGNNNKMKSYADVIGSSTSEKYVVVKPKKDSEKTKEIVKEKVYIINLPLGISRMKNSSRGKYAKMGHFFSFQQLRERKKLK